MNSHDTRYSQYALTREMLETPGIIKAFKTKALNEPVESLKESCKLFLTGEVSSRIFPAKNMIYQAMAGHSSLTIHTEGSRQAAELDLSERVLFGASNSGKTKEVISLFYQRKSKAQFGLTAHPNTPLEELSQDCFILSCGAENAVAATKSVIEQGLFYHQLLMACQGKTITQSQQDELAAKSQQVLEMPIPADWIQAMAKAPMLYFAGRNNGVAEEATLKTNEITRKKSAYLEGTYAVHGIEEVMNPDECVILVDPFQEEEEKFRDVLKGNVGLSVFAISTRDTLFPTLKIPSMSGFDTYLQLQTCWNLLVEIGLALGINLDKPVRARKIGNEFILPGQK